MRQIAYHVAASWINANAAVQLARDIRKVRGLPPRLRLSFVRYERCPHITQPTSLSPDGSFSMLPPRLLFCAPHYETIFLRTLVTPRIVAGHHPATAVATRDYSVRVLCHQCLVEPASDVEPRRTLSLQRGATRVRNDHVVAPMLRS
jgi:hypothetical protein